MPQLNPTPWFAIMMFSWLALLVFLLPKIMAHTFPNEPSSKNTQAPKTEPWAWPWH
uniref:ATP synthase complex subunit 8 n=1 Tax=Colomesus asellus TaxID=500393 RepID=I6TGK6_COLAE|nr:ATPase synthase subunit 8 [Colomesus asellus]